MDNGGRWSGSVPVANHAAAESMRCYDELPREVRDALKDASILIDPVSLHRGIFRQGRPARWAVNAIIGEGKQLYAQEFKRSTGVNPP